jgi:hypothetical protein
LKIPAGSIIVACITVDIFNHRLTPDAATSGVIAFWGEALQGRFIGSWRCNASFLTGHLRPSSISFTTSGSSATRNVALPMTSTITVSIFK